MGWKPRVAFEREFRSALAANRIAPHYQPIVALDDNRLIGFEALARWNSDNLGWVEPDQFISMAEELELISELGDRLLRQACLDARAWPSAITLAFNLSATQLRDTTLKSRILAILSEIDFSSQRLELEITETALIEQVDVAQNVIQQLREAGIRIALDDFGTGYATLSQLLAFRIDRLKIDRRFVRRLGKESSSAIIVRAILGLANEFGLATTAEGIEDLEQLAALKAHGCQAGQGHFFATAMPAEAIPDVLEKVTTFSGASQVQGGVDQAVVHQPCRWANCRSKFINQ
jgi:EAL domain-containing protein (putative c-di-GMP-specific phosphodiesterase class I)